MSAPAAAAPPGEASTATGPTVRSTARTLRGPLLVLLALVLAGVVAGSLAATDASGALDPDAYEPAGARAVAELLRDQGVEVRRAGTIEQVRAADGARTTVLVPFPEALADSELEQLADLQAALVVVSPDDAALAALGVDVTSGLPVDVETRQPACALPVAERAGTAVLGGPSYEAAPGAQAVGCYASGGRATLLALPEDRVVLLGSGAPLTNDRLDEEGNAALALGLLGAGDRAVFLLPQPGRPIADGETPPLSDLVPDGLKLGLVQVAVAVAVLALWRARRLGRVVEEPLPVVVRAAEAIEGRSRLYRAAGARGRAAEQLRAGARDRAARRLGLGLDAPREAVVAAVAARTRREPAAVDALLYGAAPVDDGALVRLADDLHSLSTALTEGAVPPEVAGS